MVHLDTLFVISIIVFTVSGSINFAHSDSCSHERYDDDDYDDRDRVGGRFEIGNGECEIDDSGSRGDHSDSGYHGSHRPRPHPRPHPHPHRPPKVWINQKSKLRLRRRLNLRLRLPLFQYYTLNHINFFQPEHCPGTWTPWINVKGAMCNDTCGNCGLIDQYRICYPIRCKCRYFEFSMKIRNKKQFFSVALQNAKLHVRIGRAHSQERLAVRDTTRKLTTPWEYSIADNEFFVIFALEFVMWYCLKNFSF